MKRRLYFLLPDVEHASRIISELILAGIPQKKIHTISDRKQDSVLLPNSIKHKRFDKHFITEWLVWRSNLLLFFVSMAALVYLLTLAPNMWFTIPVAIMTFTFVGGLIFAERVPNVHIEEFKSALAHGEILLTVDVPITQVNKIEHLIQDHHPEAVTGGVGWA